MATIEKFETDSYRLKLVHYRERYFIEYENLTAKKKRERKRKLVGKTEEDGKDAFYQEKLEFKKTGRLNVVFASNLNEFIDRFLKWSELNSQTKRTLVYHKKSMQFFKEFLHEFKIEKLNPDVYDRYKEWLFQRRGNAPRTVDVRLTAIKRMLNVLEELEVIPKGVYPKPKLIRAKNSKPPQFWTEEEVRKILDLAKGKYVYDLLVFALNTGLRAGELAYLRWEDVNLEKGFLVVQGYDIEYHTEKISFEPKNHELRRVKLNFEALNVLRMLRPNSEWMPFCFGNKRGRPRKNNMQRDLRIITKKLGIDKKGQWHCARRTFAVHVLQNGGSVEVVRQLLGHSDLKTTQRYLNVTDRHLDNAVDLINFGSEELETGKVLPFKMTT